MTLCELKCNFLEEIIMKVTVIGAGPGGYEAALYAAKHGLEVTLIEKDELGGTCLNRGCIPAKALLAVSDHLAEIREADQFGITVPEGTSFDFPSIFERKDKVVSTLTGGIGYLMQANNVKVLNGYGTIKDRKHVEVTLNNGEKVVEETDKIIIATGSVPSVPPIFTCDGKKIITSDEILSLKDQPESIIIIGGGVIGCEIAQFFARLGTKITIIEMMPHILPNEDKDVIRPLEKQFRKDGIKVLCNKGVEKLEVTENGVTASINDGSTIEGSIALVCVGRKPATRNIGLENIGLETDRRGIIPVDSHMETPVPGIYAIGDVVASAQLAHVASYEAFVAVDNIIGETREAEYHAIPRCVYTTPEIAGVGLTETEAAEKGISVKTGRYDLMGLGKAKASGKTEGFVKVLVGEDDIILGDAIAGAHGTELLEAITLSVHLRLSAKQVGNTIFPHPTMGEAIMEALHDVHGLSVHKA